MARKPVLEGGKRDEILDAALELFIEHGYEATSIRMILEKVGGEVGMFYHYFDSKQEVFDKAFALFMKRQGEKASSLMESQKEDASPRERLSQLIELFDNSMEEYRSFSGGSIHWTAACTLHDMALKAMLPAFRNMLLSLYKSAEMETPAEIALLVHFLLSGIGGVLHDKSAEDLSEGERVWLIFSLLCKVTGIPQDIFEQ